MNEDLPLDGKLERLHQLWQPMGLIRWNLHCHWLLLRSHAVRRHLCVSIVAEDSCLIGSKLLPIKRDADVDAAQQPWW